MRCCTRIGAICLALVLAVPVRGADADVKELLGRFKVVGKEGAGNIEASRAWRELVAKGPDALVPALAAMSDGDLPAANWLRSAVDAIADRELAAGRALPGDRLEAFVTQKKHAGIARRTAYEWLVRIDPTAPDRLLPGMLNDPGQELRRDAVARVIGQGEQRLAKGERDAATVTFRKAFAAARDKDQVDKLAKHLKDLDVKVDLPAHFGFITKWMVAAPFDNTGGGGFAKAYAPEKGVDLKANYKGKNDAEVVWKETTTEDLYGMVDLNKVVGKHMGAVGYAFAIVDSPVERKVQLRAGSNNAIRVYLNGKEVCFREEYHHGMRMDQHWGNATLRAGWNEVLIKVCQNEQKEDWAQSWSFQLRICDALGGAVPVRAWPETVAARPTEGKVQP